MPSCDLGASDSALAPLGSGDWSVQGVLVAGKQTVRPPPPHRVRGLGAPSSLSGSWLVRPSTASNNSESFGMPRLSHHTFPAISQTADQQTAEPARGILLRSGEGPRTCGVALTDPSRLEGPKPHGFALILPSDNLGLPTHSQTPITVRCGSDLAMAMILLQVHLQQPCYDFCFL